MPSLTETGPPGAEALRELWNSCTFVLDTSVLLNLYQYRPSVTDEMFDVLQPLRDRLWIPGQVADEYERNYPNAVGAVDKVFSEAVDAARGISRTLNTGLEKLKGDRKSLLAPVEAAIERLAEELENASVAARALVPAQSLHARIALLVSGLVGERCTPDELVSIYEQAERRFTFSIPPGLGDRGKPVPERYGDFVVWSQILAHAAAEKKPVLLVTDDHLNGDWVHTPRGRDREPRPELVHEMRTRAGVGLHICTAELFLRESRKYLHATVSEEAIEEAREVAEQPTGQAGYLTALRRAVGAVQEVLIDQFDQHDMVPYREHGFDFEITDGRGERVLVEVMYQQPLSTPARFRVADFAVRRAKILDASALPYRMLLYVVEGTPERAEQAVKDIAGLAGQHPTASVSVGYLDPNDVYTELALTQL